MNIIRTTSVLAAAAAVSFSLVPLASAQAAQAAPVKECTNAQLKAAYKGGDAATSHVFGRIVLTNVSSRTCSVRGFGGLSYVGHGDGTQVGAAADRATGTKVTTVVLRPGDKARSKVSETSTGPYDASQCTPVAVDGFRVYVPDSTASQFVAHPTTGCEQTGVHLLSHQAFKRA